MFQAVMLVCAQVPHFTEAQSVIDGSMVSDGMKARGKKGEAKRHAGMSFAELVRRLSEPEPAEPASSGRKSKRSKRAAKTKPGRAR